MYRLTAATGSFTDNNSQSYPFTLAMSYSPSGNITTKNLDAEILSADNSVVHQVYEANYTYNQGQTHTISTITGTSIDMSFQWDQNGNMTAHNDNMRSINRYLCWDEENRLMAVKNQNYLSAYMYDAAGERVWKLSGEVTQMKISGKGTIDVASLNNKTLYVSPYVVYNEQGYSKHYYAGAERVSSRIGGGTMYGLMHPINDTVSPIGTDGNGYPELASRLWGMLQRSFTNCLDLEAGYIGIEHRLNSVEHSVGNDNPEDNWYIYHSDHLGSSSFLTDSKGDPTQHLQYLPFGENYIEQRATTDYYTPYTFSAKERDLETGYSYFGARYYDPNVSIWLSVDPLSDKYPSMSAYMYVGGHPTTITDPDGRDWFQDENGNYVFDKNVTKDTKLKEGQKYMGKTGKINVVGDDGKLLYHYNLNEDGSFSDSRGKDYQSGSGTFDPKFKSGHKIMSPTITERTAKVFSEFNMGYVADKQSRNHLSPINGGDNSLGNTTTTVLLGFLSVKTPLVGICMVAAGAAQELTIMMSKDNSEAYARQGKGKGIYLANVGGPGVAFPRTAMFSAYDGSFIGWHTTIMKGAPEMTFYDYQRLLKRTKSI